MFKMGNDFAVVYMVAGMSSRFGGKIKQFARVGPRGETLIEFSIKQALGAGFNKIIFIVGDKTEVGFREMFGNSYRGVPVFYARQEFDSEVRDKPWGTADALCCTKSLIDCPFVVCNGDDIYGENSFRILFEHLKNGEGAATVGYKLGAVLSDNCGVNRGIFEIDDDGFVSDLRETFDIKRSDFEEGGLSSEDLCSMNIFGIFPEVFEALERELILFKEKNAGDRRAECLLPEELSKLVKNGFMKMKVYSTSDKWMGVTNPDDEEVARRAILEQSA